ncbi:MAG TPA: cupin domain-containing protein [Verrucomicrobiae bacterium]|jgi:quercetin dioxygenase-like cupin family protein|nr:cupin domain-containing protein [Verrucomicrobiae bacterium]
MKRSYWVSVTLLFIGIAGGFAADRLLLAQQEPVKRTMLLQTDLEDAPGKEADVFLIEMAPGASTGKHSHPGTEIAYILEGSAAVEVAGKTVPVTQRRGTVSQLTPNEVHNVSNPSRSEPLKAIVFALYDKGKPKVTPAK